jgi:hypothetical protein
MNKTKCGDNKLLRLFALSCVVLLCSKPLLGSSADQLRPGVDVRHQHSAKTGNLAEVLRFVAIKFQVAIVAELVQPLASDLKIPSGKHSAKELLELLSKAAPGYSWTAYGTVVHFYNDSVRSASENFLNVKFEMFEMPATVGDLQVLLPPQLKNRLQGHSQGYAAHGFRTLEGQALPVRTMHNVTGREILIAAAQSNPKFCTIIVFPSSKPTATDINFAFENWFWQSLDSKEPQRIYIKSPPSRS